MSGLKRPEELLKEVLGPILGMPVYASPSVLLLAASQSFEVPCWNFVPHLQVALVCYLFDHIQGYYCPFFGFLLLAAVILCILKSLKPRV